MLIGFWPRHLLAAVAVAAVWLVGFAPARARAIEVAQAPVESPASPAPPSTQTPAPAQPAEPEEEREVTRVPLVGVERGGILLKPGQFTIEPAFRYGHTSSTRLIFTGFSVIPLIILGTLESEKLEQDVLTSAFSMRLGLWKDLQLNLFVPVIFEAQQRTRLSNDQVKLVEEDTSDWGIGDVSFGLTYQLAYEKGWLPDLTLNLTARAPTGRSQFDIYEDIIKKGGYERIETFVSALSKEGLPQGSGFWATTLGISATKSVDPAVMFGSFSWTHSFEDKKNLIAITGSPSQGGVILLPQAVEEKLQPGDTLGLSIGIALSLSRELSFNFSFADSVTFPTKRDGKKVGDSRLNVATFNAGFTLALDRRVSIDVGGIAGLTEDAPDFTIGFSVPIFFDSISDLWPFGKKAP